MTFLSTDVLSAALDSGVAISVIVIFFTLQYPRNGEIGANNIMKWWGNTVFTKTGDWDSVVLRTVPEGETFGWVPQCSFWVFAWSADYRVLDPQRGIWIGTLIFLFGFNPPSPLVYYAITIFHISSDVWVWTWTDVTRVSSWRCCNVFVSFFSFSFFLRCLYDDLRNVLHVVFQYDF